MAIIQLANCNSAHMFLLHCTLLYCENAVNLLKYDIFTSPMGTLVNGKAIAEKIEANVRERVLALKKNGVIPKLAIILVGDDPRSEKYVHLKQERAKHLGIEL